MSSGSKANGNRKPRERIYRLEVDRRPLTDGYTYGQEIRLKPLNSYNYGYSFYRQESHNFPKERLVREIYRRNGYHTLKLTRSTLERSSYQDDLGVVVPYLEQKIGDNIDTISEAGIPDFLAYELASWHELSSILPAVEKIEIQEDSDDPAVSVVSCIDSVPFDKLVKEVIFVEVKDWNDVLRDSQKDWIQKHDTLSCHVAYIDTDYEPSSSEEVSRTKCSSCGRVFKNEHGIALHHAKSDCEPENSGETQ